MSDEAVPALRRRSVPAATTGLVGLAGCTSGDGDDGDGDGGGNGGGLYEGDEFTCASVAETSRTPYDVAGTGFLCQFEYPDVFDTIDTRGSPVRTLGFLRRFGGDEPYTEDQLILNVNQSNTGVKESDVRTEGDDVTELEFGDGTAYVSPTLGITGEPNRGRFTTDLPHEVDQRVRYFGVQLDLSIRIQVTDGNRDASETRATTIDETCREVAESITPNPDTAFDEGLEE
jgi:hypothetical protein